MPYKYEIINCQDPYNNSNIKRTYKVIKFTFDNNNPHAPFYYNKAWELAQKVNIMLENWILEHDNSLKKTR